MKIAYIFGSLNHGGIETLYLDLFKNKGSIPYDFICIHRKKGTLLKEYYETGIDIRPLPCKHFLSIGYIFRLRKFLAKNNIDIVHTQMAEDTIMVKLATIGRKIDTVQTVHAFDFGISWYAKRYLQWTFKHNKKTLFVTDFQRKQFETHYFLPVNKVEVVHNCMSFSKLETAEICNLTQNNHGFKFGMVGNFNSVRNQITICKALLECYKESQNFDFYFVGRREIEEPQYYDECVKFCEENGLMSCVHFLGVRSDVPAILKQLDAFVYSTVHDTFAISVLEAMATGLPVFVNDWDVMTEITHNGEFATIYKSNDHIDLAHKVCDFMANPPQYKIKATDNLPKIKELYSINRFISKLAAIYEA